MRNGHSSAMQMYCTAHSPRIKPRFSFWISCQFCEEGEAPDLDALNQPVGHFHNLWLLYRFKKCLLSPHTAVLLNLKFSAAASGHTWAQDRDLAHQRVSCLMSCAGAFAPGIYFTWKARGCYSAAPPTVMSSLLAFSTAEYTFCHSNTGSHFLLLKASYFKIVCIYLTCANLGMP